MTKFYQWIHNYLNGVIGVLAIGPALSLVSSGSNNDDAFLMTAGGLTAFISLALIAESAASPLRRLLIKLLLGDKAEFVLQEKTGPSSEHSLPVVSQFSPQLNINIEEKPEPVQKPAPSSVQNAPVPTGINLQGLDFSESAQDVGFFRQRDIYQTSDLTDLERMIVNMRPCIGRRIVFADFHGKKSDEQTFGHMLKTNGDIRQILCKEILPNVDLIAHTEMDFSIPSMTVENYFDQLKKEYVQIIFFMPNDRKPQWKTVIDMINRPSQRKVELEDLFVQAQTSAWK
jgi:hypothetical protein